MAGIEVKLLVPDGVHRRIYDESKKLGDGGKYLPKVLGIREIRTKFAALVKDTMTRTMAHNAQRNNVEVIVVGASHAYMIREDLNIPVAKCHLVGVNQQEYGYLHTTIGGVREFQRGRKITRRGKLREIIKRKRRMAA